MSNTKQIIKLENKKKRIDKKIGVLEKSVRRQSQILRNKENAKKKKLAKILLSSKIFSIMEYNNFSIHETYTIGGLVILNELDSYDSATLVATFNQIITKAKSKNDYMIKIKNIAETKYLEDRKINKDIVSKLQFIHALLSKSKLYIESADLESLKTEGTNYYIARREAKLKKDVDALLKKLHNQK